MEITNVIPLEAYRESKQPYWVGIAQCLHCHFKWVAVAPVTATVLECLKCQAMVGARITESGKDIA